MNIRPKKMRKIFAALLMMVIACWSMEAFAKYNSAASGGGGSSGGSYRGGSHIKTGHKKTYSNGIIKKCKTQACLKKHQSGEYYIPQKDL